MKNLDLRVIAVAIGLAFSAGVLADSMTKNEYKAGKYKIEGEYKAARAECKSLAGNPADVCVAEAKGAERVAMAELDAAYKPSRKSRYKVRMAKADAGYDVAKEKCEELAGNANDVCVKEAKAARTALAADAEARLKTKEADDEADEKTTAAHEKAKATGDEARDDAAAKMLESQYQVAKEKCDKFSGDAKNTCLDEAKAHYGKS